MRLEILLPFQVFAARTDVTRIVAETPIAQVAALQADEVRT